VKISALTGKGIDDLQELILMQAEDLQLEAEHVSLAEGAVVETVPSAKGLGIETTVLVQWGTLNVGDAVVAGQVAGKIRLMFDASTGKSIKSALPSQPVRIIGLKEPPLPGDTLQVLPDERTAKEIGAGRAKQAKKAKQQQDHKILAANLKSVYKDAAVVKQENIDPELEGRATQSSAAGIVLRSGDNSQPIETELVLILKTDVYSSFEAIQQTVKEQMANDHQLAIRFIHSGPGQVSELEVELAKEAQTCIVCFRTDATPRAQKEADSNKVPIHKHLVIYDAIAEIRKQAEAKLLPHVDAQLTGELHILKPFSITVKGTLMPVAGCRVVKGEVNRSQVLRLLRDGRVISEGPVQSLKLFKEDINLVKKGSECGVRIEGWDDYQVGDILQAIKYIKTPRQFGEVRRNDFQTLVENFREQARKAQEELEAKAAAEKAATAPESPSPTSSSPFSRSSSSGGPRKNHGHRHR
jgi:translation initiation factor IF-2